VGAKWLSERVILGSILILFTLILFTAVVWKGMGGDRALFLIIGHTAAWAEMIVIFYFRKKPPEVK